MLYNLPEHIPKRIETVANKACFNCFIKPVVLRLRVSISHREWLSTKTLLG
jgi:hypothetical protein